MVSTMYPPVSASTIEDVRQQRRTMEANPELQTPPAELGLTDRFIFRTKPGTVRMVVHNIPQAPMEGLDEKKDRFIRREWERRMLRTFKKTDSKETNQQVIARAEKYYADVTEANDGDAILRFSKVSKRNECFFTTNSPVLGAYVRDLVKRRVGEFEYVYEQNGLSRIVVGLDTDKVMAFPNTAGGRIRALAYADEHSLTDIKIVDE